MRENTVGSTLTLDSLFQKQEQAEETQQSSEQRTVRAYSAFPASAVWPLPHR